MCNHFFDYQYWISHTKENMTAEEFHFMLIEETSVKFDQYLRIFNLFHNVSQLLFL